MALRGIPRCRIPDCWLPSLTGVSEEALAALRHSLMASSLKGYNAYLARFERFCLQTGVEDWREASLVVILDFLCLITRNVERPASVLDGAISALKTAFVQSGVMDSPWIARVKKGLIASRTTRARKATEPVPAEPICAWLRRLPDNDALSFVELRRKVAVLAAMVLIARPSDLTHIMVDSVQLLGGGLEMSIDLLAFKNDYHRDGASLVVQACSEPKLCFIRACMALLQRLRARFGRPAALFVHEHRNEPLKAASIGRILKEGCAEAGIGNVFSGRNFRPGGATRGLAGGLPLDYVMHTGRWSNAGTVYGHYVRTARQENATDILMGLRSGTRALDAT